MRAAALVAGIVLAAHVGSGCGDDEGRDLGTAGAPPLPTGTAPAPAGGGPGEQSETALPSEWTRVGPPGGFSVGVPPEWTADSFGERDERGVRMIAASRMPGAPPTAVVSVTEQPIPDGTPLDVFFEIAERTRASIGPRPYKPLSNVVHVDVDGHRGIAGEITVRLRGRTARQAQVVLVTRNRGIVATVAAAPGDYESALATFRQILDTADLPV